MNGNKKVRRLKKKKHYGVRDYLTRGGSTLGESRNAKKNYRICYICHGVDDQHLSVKPQRC